MFITPDQVLASFETNMQAAVNVILNEMYNAVTNVDTGFTDNRQVVKFRPQSGTSPAVLKIAIQQVEASGWKVRLVKSMAVGEQLYEITRA